MEVRLARFTSPRLRGEVGSHAAKRNAIRVRGTLHESDCDRLRGESPSPRPSPRARGEGEETPHCVKALYLASEAFSSAIAASGSTPVFLTPSAQVLTSGSEAFFHCASCSGVSV